MFESIAARLGANSPVPSIPRARPDPLEGPLARVARAEQELKAARAEARRVAKANGKPLGRLFEDSYFVRRSSAESWERQAEREGYERASREIGDVHLRAAGLDPKVERARIKAELAAWEIRDRAQSARWRAVARDAGLFDAINQKDYERAGRIMFELNRPDNVTPFPQSRERANQIQARIRAAQEPDLSDNAAIGAPTDPAELAVAIGRAGAKARTPTDADPPPRPMNALSSAIVAAGEERRNPKPWSPPT